MAKISTSDALDAWARHVTGSALYMPGPAEFSRPMATFHVDPDLRLYLVVDQILVSLQASGPGSHDHPLRRLLLHVHGDHDGDRSIESFRWRLVGHSECAVRWMLGANPGQRAMLDYQRFVRKLEPVLLSLPDEISVELV